MRTPAPSLPLTPTWRSTARERELARGRYQAALSTARAHRDRRRMQNASPSPPTNGAATRQPERFAGARRSTPRARRARTSTFAKPRTFAPLRTSKRTRGAPFELETATVALTSLGQALDHVRTRGAGANLRQGPRRHARRPSAGDHRYDAGAGAGVAGRRRSRHRGCGPRWSMAAHVATVRPGQRGPI